MKVAIIAQEGSILVDRWIEYCLELGYEVYHIKRNKENRDPGVHEVLLPQPCPLFPDSEIAEELEILKDVPGILLRDKHQYAMRLKTYRDILKEIKPDVVHAHWIYDFGLHAALASRGIAPFVQSVWGSDVFIIPLFIEKNFVLLQYVLSNADRVLGNSRTLLDTAASFLDIDIGPRSFLTKWGIKPAFNPSLYNKNKLRETYGYHKEDVIVLSARGFKPVYNIRTVIRSFDRARQRYPRLKLILVGRGHGWEDYTPTDGGVCRVMDWVNHETVAELMALSDISISIPFSDSMANTLVESLAMKLYLIVSDLPSVREFIKDGVHAKLVNPMDINEVTSAICRYFEDPGSIERMASESGAICREFSEQNALENIKKIYCFPNEIQE